MNLLRRRQVCGHTGRQEGLWGAIMDITLIPYQRGKVFEGKRRE